MSSCDAATPVQDVCPVCGNVVQYLSLSEEDAVNTCVLRRSLGILLSGDICRATEVIRERGCDSNKELRACLNRGVMELGLFVVQKPSQEELLQRQNEDFDFSSLAGFVRDLRKLVAGRLNSPSIFALEAKIADVEMQYPQLAELEQEWDQSKMDFETKFHYDKKQRELLGKSEGLSRKRASLKGKSDARVEDLERSVQKLTLAVRDMEASDDFQQLSQKNAAFLSLYEASGMKALKEELRTLKQRQGSISQRRGSSFETICHAVVQRHLATLCSASPLSCEVVCGLQLRGLKVPSGASAEFDIVVLRRDVHTGVVQSVDCLLECKAAAGDIIDDIRQIVLVLRFLTRQDPGADGNFYVGHTARIGVKEYHFRPESFQRQACVVDRSSFQHQSVIYMTQPGGFFMSNGTRERLLSAVARANQYSLSDELFLESLYHGARDNLFPDDDACAGLFALAQDQSLWVLQDPYAATMS